MSQLADPNNSGLTNVHFLWKPCLQVYKDGLPYKDRVWHHKCGTKTVERVRRSSQRPHKYIWLEIKSVARRGRLVEGFDRTPWMELTSIIQQLQMHCMNSSSFESAMILSRFCSGFWHYGVWGSYEIAAVTMPVLSSVYVDIHTLYYYSWYHNIIHSNP